MADKMNNLPALWTNGVYLLPPFDCYQLLPHLRISLRARQAMYMPFAPPKLLGNTLRTRVWNVTHLKFCILDHFSVVQKLFQAGSQAGMHASMYVPIYIHKHIHTLKCIPHTYHVLEASIALCGSWWNNEKGSCLSFLCSLARIPEFVFVPFVDADASHTKHFRYGQACMFHAGKDHVASLGLKACLVHLHLPHIQYTCVLTLGMSSWLFASNWVCDKSMCVCLCLIPWQGDLESGASVLATACRHVWWHCTLQFFAAEFLCVTHGKPIRLVPLEILDTLRLLSHGPSSLSSPSIRNIPSHVLF